MSTSAPRPPHASEPTAPRRLRASDPTAPRQPDASDPTAPQQPRASDPTAPRQPEASDPTAPRQPHTDQQAAPRHGDEPALPSSVPAHPVSLEARLVATVVLAVALATAVFGGAVILVLRDYLIRQVDDQLRSTAPAVAQVTLDDLRRSAVFGSSMRLPSDYAVLVHIEDDGRTIPFVSEVGLTQPLPEVEPLTAAAAERTGGQPYTLLSADGTSRWRVVSLPVSETGDVPVGSVSVALPLEIDETVGRMAGLAGVIGVGIVAAAGLAGRTAVRRSFRPLHDVELTAAAIAGGDLSRRVPVDGQDIEVARLTRALNGMLSRIEESIRVRDASQRRMRRFVSDASHELRTPLASIRGFAELRRQGAVPDDEVDATFDRIEREARRLGRLVEDLLLLAKLDERRPMRRDRLDLTALVQDAGTDARALAPDRTVDVTGLAGGPVAPTPVVGDGDRLRQVMANLVGNAVRHTPAGTPLTLRVGPASSDAVVEVVDHGPGIPTAERARVFERFARLDASRHRKAGGGAGLGLSIVAAVVQGHEGSVSIDETPGGGATFQVRLPLGDAGSVRGPGDG